MPKDFQRLPKLRDSLSFLYIERAIIEQDNLSIRAIRADGTVPIPIAAMTVLMLGPGVSIMPPSKPFVTTVVPSSGAERPRPVFMLWEWAKPEALITCCIRRSSAWMKNFTCRASGKCMKDGFPI